MSTSSAQENLATVLLNRIATNFVKIAYFLQGLPSKQHRNTIGHKTEPIWALLSEIQ